MMKGLTLLLFVVSASGDLNGFKPMYAPPLNIDRQGISYSTSVHHPHPDPEHPDHQGAQSTIDVTFGTAALQPQQNLQESRISNVFNKGHYTQPKTIENYQKPLQYQNQGGVLTAKVPDSQLFNVGYSVSFADAAKKNFKKSVYRQPEGDIITGTRKTEETVQKPLEYKWQQQHEQNSPLVEIIKSDELALNSNSATNLHSQKPQQFDHANALGRSIGFDHTNIMEGDRPIYKQYVRPGGTLEKKAEHYFNNKQPVRIVQLQGAASGAVPSFENAADGQASQLGRYEAPKGSAPPKLPIDTRLLRNPILLTPDASGNLRNDPNVIPIHFDTRQLQETFQKEQQPFNFPDYNQQSYQQEPVRHAALGFQETGQQQSGRVYNGNKAYPVEKRGGFKKELALRQPRYTPKVQIQTLLRPPPQIYQRKVLVTKLH